MPESSRVHRLGIEMPPQPDWESCGPTCLHAVYRYWGEAAALADVRDSVPMLEAGGTLGVYLALDAQRRGYACHLYTYNLHVFDPTWFQAGGRSLREGLLARSRHVEDDKTRLACEAYLQYLDLGGVVEMVDLTPRFIVEHLKRGEPIITGLSATWLYREARVFGPEDRADDVRGEPSGHFVVLTGYDGATRTVDVADPMQPNPISRQQTYTISIERLVCAILLGIVTYDANLLIAVPKGQTKHVDRHR